MNAKALLLGALGTLIGGSASAAIVTIDYVAVGNAGNANNTTGLGAVASQFNIGKYEVTNAQYAEFLNAKAVSDPLGLYNAGMDSNPLGGITRLGNDGAFTYAAKTGFETKPVVFVGFYDAARFANWLNNGQGSASTETGAYTLLGGTAVPTNGATFTRNAGAGVWVPSENEWYKAAYHQPGADANDYWLYPTRSNAEPLATSPNSTNANSANFTSPSFSSPGLTAVGGFTLASSFYGTFDQGGNVIEWNDSIVAANQRGLRGGTWQDFELFMRATSPDMSPATQEDEFIGFRVAAAVPEPTVFGSLVLGMALIAARRRKVC
jgi:formylglycine-generating enzyme required for sulfatase activity